MPEAAYLAGLWDGEGSIMLLSKRDTIAVRISIVNTDRAMLDWIVQATGLSIVLRHRDADTARGHKATWQWGCNGDAALSVLRQIRPYLITKASHADLALATQERLRNPALKFDRNWQEESRQRMRQLNARGPISDGG